MQTPRRNRRDPLDPFEDHCWKDVIPPDVIELYSSYGREVGVGPSPALLAIDLYELAYQGGARPVQELMRAYPSSCGEHAWAAIEPTKRLFAAARAAGLPVIYSTRDTRPQSQAKAVRSTHRRGEVDSALYAIRPEFNPQPQDTVITKLRASAFFGTPLAAHLTQLGVQPVVCGEHLGLRASAVDAYSHGFHVTPSRMLPTAARYRTRSTSSTCTTSTPTLHATRSSPICKESGRAGEAPRLGVGHGGTPDRQGGDHHGQRARYRQGLRSGHG
jgi:nicotinamidase-related amidase